VQGLYNPDRLRTPLLRDSSGRLRPASWQEAEKQVAGRLAAAASRRDSVAMISGPVSGAMEELIAAWTEAFGSKRWLRYEPVAYESLRAGNQLCFGRRSLPVLRFADAKATHVFGTDVLETFISPVGYARGIAEARRAGGRLVYFGSRLSLTGANADEWVAVEPGGDGIAAMALLREILAEGGATPLSGPLRAALGRWSEPFTAARAGIPEERLRALARELTAAPSLAVTGGLETCDQRALATAVAVNLLNTATGALNRTVRFDRASPLDRTATRAELTAFEDEMERGALQAVVIAEANPVYSSPGFAAALRQVPLVICLSPYPDETTAAAHVVLPVSTPLESWGDHEPWTGVHSLQQPAMRPVFDTRDLGDVLLETAPVKPGAPDFREYVRNRWRRIHRESGAGEDFEAFWAAALERGGFWRDVPDTRVELAAGDLGPALQELLAGNRGGQYTLRTYASLARFDGRGANRPWLQEIPDPVTQAVWGSWVEMNPADAEKLGAKTGNRIRLRTQHGAVELPAYVYPGIQAGTLAVPLGQGHTAFGRYATGVGVNAAALLDPAADPATGGTRWSGAPAELALLAKERELVTVGGSLVQKGRKIVPAEAAPGAGGERHRLPTLYGPPDPPRHRWAMAIDLDACTACGACIAACYAENNVPVVGKEEIRRGRLMSWIRLERFFGEGERIVHPLRIDWTMMLCQHCDNAPCEPVCPVYATFHSQEGLNGQVYNRCVGTRYCANNCPYKARRFNWYGANWAAPLDWQLNPDVTVRSVGVMEKCTFCVQRIVQAKDRARLEGRPLQDGEATPACAQSCPTQAIVFGDAKDPNSRVSRLRARPDGARVLEEVNTRPAITYIPRGRRKAEA
jgi:molybdopterin-containing oxidoreductase family iron-sulfur binding subunit